MIETLKGQLEMTYGEIVDVLSRRLESVWDTLKEMQEESNALKERMEAARAVVVDLQQALMVTRMDEDERVRFEANLRKLEDLLT